MLALFDGVHKKENEMHLAARQKSQKTGSSHNANADFSSSVGSRRPNFFRVPEVSQLFSLIQPGPARDLNGVGVRVQQP